MNDLISRAVAIDDLHTKDPSMIWDTADVEVWVDALPSAQPEIIRCKDCKYSSPNMVYGCRLERYSYHDDSVRMYSEDFCSKAERRE